MAETAEGGNSTQRGSLEILAERASRAKPNTLLLPSPEPEAKGFVIQENLAQTPLTVGNQVFSEGSLVAILKKNPDTQQDTLEFRIYERVQRIQERGSQKVELMPRTLILGIDYANAAKETQQMLLRLTLQTIKKR